MPIKDWPAAERPREKLLLRGPAALSDAELLAIFLDHGIRDRDAVSLGVELFDPGFYLARALPLKRGCGRDAQQAQNQRRSGKNGRPGHVFAVTTQIEAHGEFILAKIRTGTKWQTVSRCEI